MSQAVAPTSSPPRVLSIDVEDYFQIESAFAAIGRDNWHAWEPRVERNVELLLSLFHRFKRRGTFFCLGYVAQKHPQVIRRIAEAGHEIASHGSMHDRLHRLTPATFRDDLLASKHLLEDQCQRPVIGYRAPTFSVTPQTAWAVDVLVESGFAYDASIFPVRHPLYGVPSAPDRPFMAQGRPGGATILEIPPLTWRIAGRNLPVAGGGYFRLLPLWFMRRGLAQATRQNRPAVLYFHPWEFDPAMPRMPLSRTGKLRTYTGLAKAENRLARIMATPGRWVRIVDALDEFRAIALQSPPFVLADAASSTPHVPPSAG